MDDYEQNGEVNKPKATNKILFFSVIVIIAIVLIAVVFIVLNNQKSAPEKTVDTVLDALNQNDPDLLIEHSTLKYMNIALQTEYAIYTRTYPNTFSNTVVQDISYSDEMTVQEKTDMLEEINITQFETNHAVDITEYCLVEITGDIFDEVEGTTQYDENQDVYLVQIDGEWLFAGLN